MTQLRDIRTALILNGTNVRGAAADTALVESIRQHGILQPIVVRPVGQRGRYEVVMGFRRMAAARRLGLETVPCVIDERPQDDQILRQVAENVDRRAMNPIDVALALQAYLDAHPGMQKQQLAASLGRTGRAGSVWIANKLALLRLEEPIREKVASGEIPEHVAIKGRQHLNDGRGRPRAIPLPTEEGKSRSVTIPIGRYPGGQGGTADVSIDLEAHTVDVALHMGDRGLFLGLTAAEARLFGKRLQQAGEAMTVAPSHAPAKPNDYGPEIVARAERIS